MNHVVPSPTKKWLICTGNAMGEGGSSRTTETSDYALSDCGMRRGGRGEYREHRQNASNAVDGN